MQQIRYFTSIFMIFGLMMACRGQDNFKYIGKEYGTFDLDKLSFTENLDSLFSKVPKEDMILLDKKDSYYDSNQGKTVVTEISEYIYRISKSKIKGYYSFKNLKLNNDVVSFYSDPQKRFRRVDFAVYLTKNDYEELLKQSKDFKDITTESVRKFNNGKYQILQKINNNKKITLYCLIDKDERGDYFVRVRINNLEIKGDKFDKKWNSDFGY